MAGAKAGVRVPRVGSYGKVIGLGAVFGAALIILTDPNTAYAAEHHPNWRDDTSGKKCKCECSDLRQVITYASWWNTRSWFDQNSPDVDWGAEQRASSWVDFGLMTARECRGLESRRRIISTVSVIGYTIYNTERSECRWGGRTRDDF